MRAFFVVIPAVTKAAVTAAAPAAIGAVATVTADPGCLLPGRQQSEHALMVQTLPLESLLAAAIGHHALWLLAHLQKLGQLALADLLL